MTHKRLLIYFYTDNCSSLDRYISYCLEHIQKFISEIVIVTNQNITYEIKHQFNNFSNNIYINEKIEDNISAYKAGIENYGWDNLANFDEIIFMNDHIFGPINDFKDLFDSMDSEDISFWEIVENSSPKEDDIISLLNENVDMYFMAIRKDMFTHNEFKIFLCNIYNNQVNIRKVFIHRFIHLGFKYKAYINDKALNSHVPNIIIHAPKLLIEKYNCPIFLKDIFMLDYKNWTVYSNGNEVIELLQYLIKQTNYDIDMVYESIIRTVNQYDFKYYMHHNYILSEQKIERHINHNLKIALMMHLYYDDLFMNMLEYAKNMPDYADILISTQTEEKKEKLLQLTKDFPHKIKVIVIENRGRDVSALTVAFREYIYEYDIVCFAHDKKVSQADYVIKGKVYERHCFDNILPTKEYVINVINRFAEDDKIGMLVPPAPLFAEYYPSVSGYGCGWGINYSICKELLEKLNIQLELDINKGPIAPYGSIFWFRVDALKPLFELNLQYNDFPEEPVACDGTISHAIERLHSYIAQSRGYYTSWIFSHENASIYISNLHYMLSEVNKKVYQFFPSNYFIKELDDIDALKYKIENMSIEINKLNRVKEKYDNHIRFLETSYNSIINSKSWKITKPYRIIMNLFKRIFRYNNF